MDLGRDIASLSDGCTGFWLFQMIWHIYDCCAVHDGGGSDGTLLDCLTTNGVPAMFAALGIAIMALFRPLYHLIKRIRAKS